MARDVLGKVGLGYTQCEVSIVTDPTGKSMLGAASVFLNVEHIGADKAKVALWLNGKHLDELILLLREGKRRLLEAETAGS